MIKNAEVNVDVASLCQETRVVRLMGITFEFTAITSSTS
jgi:hypothetical protein